MVTLIRGNTVVEAKMTQLHAIMFYILLLCLSIASPICCQFRFGSRTQSETRLGLISTDLGLPPVPLQQQSKPGVGSHQPLRENPVCDYQQRCCCVQEYECQKPTAPGNDGAGIIDIRIVNKPTGGSQQQQQCQYPLVQCCSDQTIVNPYCDQGKECCCVRRGTCPVNNDGSGIIDIRFIATRNRQCRRNEELCCAQPYQTQPPPYQPPQTQPPPYRPPQTQPPPYRPPQTQPPYQPEPSYPSSGQINLHPLNGNDCGYSQSHPSGNYQGGYGQADFGEYNFLVVILDLGNAFVGAGALLNPTTVITADHKIFNHTARYLKVRAREWDANGDVEPLPYIEVPVSRIISHPRSNVRYAQLTNLKNDVAIIQLAKPISFHNEYVGSVCLPPQATQFTGQNCWVAGWGKDSFGPHGQYQQILKEVDIRILSSYQCESKLKRTRLGPNFQFDGHTFICAGGEQGKDACEGDGGAPLVCNVQGRWYLAGLVAWGIGCAQRDVPGVYVNVPSFSNWIHQNSAYGGRG